MTVFNPGKPARTVSKGVICSVEDQEEVLYTCPTSCRAEVTMLFCVNANGNTSALAKWYKADTSQEFYLIGGKNLGTGDYILLTGATLVLEPNDEIRCIATGNTAPTLDYMCTVTETFIPVG